MSTIETFSTTAVTPVSGVSIPLLVSYTINQDIGCHTRSLAGLHCNPAASGLPYAQVLEIAQEFEIKDLPKEGSSKFTSPMSWLWRLRNEKFCTFLINKIYPAFANFILQISAGKTLFLSDRLARATKGVEYELITVSKFASWLLENTTCPCIATPPRFNSSYVHFNQPTIVQSFIFLVPDERAEIPFGALDRAFSVNFQRVGHTKDAMDRFMLNSGVSDEGRRYAWGDSEVLFGKYFGQAL